jgi:hypothetical protein
VDKYLAGYVNLAGPLLGLPKALSPMLSGVCGRVLGGGGQHMGVNGRYRHDVTMHRAAWLLLSKGRLHQCMPCLMSPISYVCLHACAPKCRQDSNACSITDRQSW